MDDVKSRSDRLFVAAIDIGTTYSGYAFSDKDNWSKVVTKTWPGKLSSQKQPTALLLDSEQKFVAFGYNAVERYSELVDNEDHNDYFYFLRFKMILHEGSNLTRKTCCEDEQGKKMAAIQVFAFCIGHLKDDLLHLMQQSVPDITVNDINFVITVPAIWSDKAKQLMKEAAILGGIEENQLKIALEPEAASIFCQYYKDDSKQLSESENLGVVTPGTKYMVCDLGGGTADITVHEKCNDGTLKEIRPASGGKWGGKSVNDNFLDFLNDVFGADVLKRLKKECMEDYMYLCSEFELLKRKFNHKKEGTVFLKVPMALRDFVKEDKTKQSMENAINTSIYAGKVLFESAQMKLKWKATDFAAFFQTTISNLLCHLEKMFQEGTVEDVNTILMVGGFSECDLVQTSIRDNFRKNKKRFIVPEECGLTVLKGAVYFGHIPGAISRRTLQYTYGIQSWPEFNPTIHSFHKKVYLSQCDVRCRDVFFKYATKGEHLEPGSERSRVFKPLKPEEKRLECAVYVSDKVDPKYVDEEGCKKLGVLIVKLPENHGGSLEIKETMIFGETQIKMTAEKMSTGEKQELSFDMLEDYDAD